MQLECRDPEFRRSGSPTQSV